jgi:hypothetical protein
VRRLLALAAFALAFGANADPIGGPDSDCGTCQGSAYALFYSGAAQPDSDPLTQTFDIFLAIQTATYTGGPLTSTWIDDVAIKVSPSFTDASLIAAPTGVANWTEIDGGISNVGCDGNGGGFACADFNHVAPFDPITNPPGVALGGLLLWEFSVTMLNGDLTGTGLMGSVVKVRYVDTVDGKVGALVSENLTLQTGGCPPSVCSPFSVVPEPMPLALLLGAGFAGLAFVRRRK